MSLMIFYFIQRSYTTSKTNGSSKMEGIINEINIYNAKVQVQVCICVMFLFHSNK